MAQTKNKYIIVIDANNKRPLTAAMAGRRNIEFNTVTHDKIASYLIFLAEVIEYFGGGHALFSCDRFDGNEETGCWDYKWRLYNDDFSIYRNFISKRHLWQNRSVVCEDVTNVVCSCGKYKLDLSCAGDDGFSQLTLTLDGVSKNDSMFITRLAERFFNAVRTEESQSEVIDDVPEQRASESDYKCADKDEELIFFKDIYDAAQYGGLNAVEKYINQGVPADQKNADSKTPLFIVCERFDERLEIAGFLLSHGANVRVCNEYRQSALFAASEKGHAEIVKLLLKNGASPQTSDLTGMFAIHAAAMYDRPYVIKLLIESGAPVDAKDGGKYTALHIATMNKNLDSVIMLVNCGASIMKKNPDGHTAIDIAKNRNFNEIATFLEDAQKKHNNNTYDERIQTPLPGDDVVQAKNNNLNSEIHKKISDAPQYHSKNTVEKKSGNGQNCAQTAEIGCSRKNSGNNSNSKIISELTSAAARSDEFKIKELLDKGADINCHECNGQTPLIAVVSKLSTSLKALKLLINSGACLDAADNKGNTALIYAAEKNNVGAMNELTDAGCDMDIRNKSGETALYLAAFNGSYEACRHLLSAGANLEIAAKYKRTPLIAAAAKGDIKTALHLIYSGADINIMPDGNWNALMYAVYNDNYTLAEELINFGAKVNFQDCSGETPIIKAASKLNGAMIKLLLDAGADPEIKDIKGRNAIDAAVEASAGESIINLIASKCGQEICDKVKKMKFRPERVEYVGPLDTEPRGSSSSGSNSASSSASSGNDRMPPLPEGFEPSQAFRRFYDSFFGSAYMAWHDGLDLESIDLLKGEERELAEKLLLEYGDHRASTGLGQLKSAKSAELLKENLKSSSAQEVVNTAVALKKIENDDKYCENIIYVLKKSVSEYDKLEAAIALRHFKTRESIAALYEAVCDEHYLVRYHACDSLLILYGMKSGISDYKEIFQNIIGGKNDEPVTPIDRQRFRQAVILLKSMFEK
ncbi:MAG: ankyrin repeat domain-containing protein [Candidatus Wallbacteria bacterium]